jgi:uncharacterized protein (DUF2249 family)
VSNSIITLDVREDIRNGREPFTKIMQAVDLLTPDQGLLLTAPFEPVPLLHVLARRGFTHRIEKGAGDEWQILFTRAGASAQSKPVRQNPGACGCSCSPGQPATVIELDARGLEPPQPLVAILEALASLPQNAELRAQTDRRPLHLYAQLEERGFTGQTEETEHGSFITHIRRS